MSWNLRDRDVRLREAPRPWGWRLLGWSLMAAFVEMLGLKAMGAPWLSWWVVTAPLWGPALAAVLWLTALALWAGRRG